MKFTGRYPKEGLVIMTILLLTGIFLIYNMLNARRIDVMVFVICVFFIITGLYIWHMYICNILIKPKKKILYLVTKEKSTYKFIDEKGKKYKFRSIKNYELSKFYYVLKTKDDVKKILELSDEKFEKIEKESFWLNWYSPFGNFKNIFLLPIVYVIFLGSLLSLILYEGVFAYTFLIQTILTSALVIYDLVYKWKKKNNKKGKIVDTKKLDHFFSILLYVAHYIIPLVLVSLVILYLFFAIKDIVVRIFILPFLITILSADFSLFFRLLKIDKIASIFDKINEAVPLIIGFIILVLLTISLLTNGQYFGLIILFVVWIIFFFLGRGKFKK